MFRQVTALLFLLAFMGQTFNRAVIVLDFYANQKYIAQNFCENRDKPQMNCCGKCQLKKKLNKEDSKSKQNPRDKNDSRDEVLSSKSFFPSIQSHQICVISNFSGYKIWFPKDRATAFFHPPGGIAFFPVYGIAAI